MQQNVVPASDSMTVVSIESRSVSELMRLRFNIQDVFETETESGCVETETGIVVIETIKSGLKTCV